jgi:hypothetical protein
MASTPEGVDDPNRTRPGRPQGRPVGEGFSRLAHYVERQGDARVPASFTVDGYPPGSWVDMQRNRHTKGALNVDRERRLRDLTGLDLGPRGRPLAPDRAPLRPHHGQPRAVRRAARLEGQPRPRPGRARQAARQQAHTALTLYFVDGDHAMLEQFLGFARNDPTGCYVM